MEYAPAPRALVFVILGVLFPIGIVAVAVMPETARPHPGALTWPRPRVGVPSGTRGRFLAVVPTLVATRAVAGLYLSLGPSPAAGILGVRSHPIGGLVVFAPMIATATTSIVPGGRRSPALTAAGMAVSPIGPSRTADIYASAVIMIAPAFTLGSIMTRKADRTA
ncbi:hypothetical protein [Embleya hyalina]|uniref:MFS transporter n=1 Tax=Embleya hyalina TaxID=516124 RepID=A0A401YTQ6_9ACTN|nr:hypothetical protein [Embleya hyalina]GCD97935.1 MFS transporter [Embleya hyalina]